MTARSIVALLSLLGGCGWLLDLDPEDVDAPDAAVADAAADAETVDATAGDGARPDAGRRDAGPPVDCVTVAECPPAPCGEYRCVDGLCALDCDCVDLDLDGFGEGPDCLGPDCDDGDPEVTLFGVSECGRDLGACFAGDRICLAGEVSECIGEIRPATEQCNGVDDDCDGRVDEDVHPRPTGYCSRRTCAGGRFVDSVDAATPLDDCGGGDTDCDGFVDEDCDDCVYVLEPPEGMTIGVPVDPTNATTPHPSLQAALDLAGRAGTPNRVCIQVPTCGAPHRVTHATTIAVPAGVVVRGGFRARSDLLCPGSPDAAPEVQLLPGSNVVHTVRVSGDSPEPTVVERVGVVVPDVRRPDTPVSAIRITSDGVRLHRVAVLDGPPVSLGPVESYGVWVDGASDVTIRESSIAAGRGDQDAIGVYATSAPGLRVHDNCPGVVGTPCRAECPEATLFRGRGIFGAALRGARSHAIELLDSPDALVQGNLTCHLRGESVAHLKVVGASGRTVAVGNSFGAARDLDSDGVTSGRAVWALDCEELLLEDDVLIGFAGSGGVGQGLRAEGDCRVVAVDQQVLASAGRDGVATAVSCVRGAECAIASSFLSAAGSGVAMDGSDLPPGKTIGIECVDACQSLVSNILLLMGDALDESVGIELTRARPIVIANFVNTGCPLGDSVRAAGVVARDAPALLLNNFIRTSSCGLGTDAGAGARFVGLDVFGSARPGVTPLIALHNTVVPTGREARCSSAGVSMSTERSGALLAFLGNNLVRAGACPAGTGVADDGEAFAAVDGNMFDPVHGGVVYRLGSGASAESFTALDIDALNAVLSERIGGEVDNRAEICPLVAAPDDLHLAGTAATNACVDPRLEDEPVDFDIDGDRRDDRPDIGADELRP